MFGIVFNPYRADCFGIFFYFSFCLLLYCMVLYLDALVGGCYCQKWPSKNVNSYNWLLVVIKGLFIGFDFWTTDFSLLLSVYLLVSSNWLLLEIKCLFIGFEQLTFFCNQVPIYCFGSTHLAFTTFEIIQQTSLSRIYTSNKMLQSFDRSDLLLTQWYSMHTCLPW